jgi:hypothetical protein
MSRNILAASAIGMLALTAIAMAMPARSQPPAAPKAIAAEPAKPSALLLPAVQAAREAARRSQSAKTMTLATAPQAAKDDAHKETIEIASWSLGATNTSACSGKVGAGRLDLTTSTPIRADASGKPRIAVLEVMDAQGGPLEIIMEDVVISSAAPTPTAARAPLTYKLVYNRASWARTACGGPPARVAR